MNKRAMSLDALRGLAIVGMVLSATLGPGLPSWMHHAQEPPPSFAYNPAISGITWVDLVFPLFLFAMGAAFPLSIGKRASRGESRLKITFDILKRGLKLAFFSVYVQHFYPYMLNPEGGIGVWSISILSFALLFPMFMKLPWKMPSSVRTGIKAAAYLAGTALLLAVCKEPIGFGVLKTNNPILLILAYMSVLGGLSYLFTIGKPLLRCAIIVLLSAFTVGSTVDGSWHSAVSMFNPIEGFYQPDYIKYLLIVLPATFAGGRMKRWANVEAERFKPKPFAAGISMAAVSLAVVAANLYFLFTRQMVWGVVSTSILLLGGLAMLSWLARGRRLWNDLFSAGAFLILLGLMLEPLGGGIKKDPPTLSYLFVTCGIGFMFLFMFHIFCDCLGMEKPLKFLSMPGQNPMVAYVAGDLLVNPLLNIVGLFPVLLAFFARSPLLALVQGLFLTSLSVLITMFFTRMRWFWRT